MTTAPTIKSVRPVEDMLLYVRFTNGDQRVYNCNPLLNRPQFRLLSTPAFFNSVRVDSGGYGVSWNDDIDLSEYELWVNGKPV